MGRGRRYRLRASGRRTPQRRGRSTRILAADFSTGSAVALPAGGKPRVRRTHAVDTQRIRTRGGGGRSAPDQSGAFDEHLSAYRPRLAHAHPSRFAARTRSRAAGNSAIRPSLMQSYRAPWWLPGGHLQTIYPYFLLKRRPPPYRRERWETPDGDFIDVDWADDRDGHAP